MQLGIMTGNAPLEGVDHRGWFMGYFITPIDDPRCNPNLELKWGIHPAGDSRQEWGRTDQATTISILINGRFKLLFPTQEVILTQPGDYALWLPGVAHTWFAEESSTVLSIRYPSLPS